MRGAFSLLWKCHTHNTTFQLPVGGTRLATGTRRTTRAASFFFGVYSWLVKVLGQFSIIYFRGLGLRVGVRVWVRVRVGVRVRFRVRVRVSVVLWSE